MTYLKYVTNRISHQHFSRMSHISESSLLDDKNHIQFITVLAMA